MVASVEAARCLEDEVREARRLVKARAMGLRRTRACQHDGRGDKSPGSPCRYFARQDDDIIACGFPVPRAVCPNGSTGWR